MKVLDDAIGTFRYAVRALRRSPMTSVAAFLSLVLAIGATTATFAITDLVLFRPLPWRHADRVFVLQLIGVDARKSNPTWSYPRYREFEHATWSSIEETAAFERKDVEIRSEPGGAPVRTAVEFASENYLSTIGVVPERGRDLNSSTPGSASPTGALISHAFWVNKFNRDPAIIGRFIYLNSSLMTVIGVTPPAFAGMSGKVDVWAPASTAPTILGDPNALSPLNWKWTVVARERTGVTSAQRSADLDARARQLGLSESGPLGKSKLSLVPSRDLFVRVDFQRALWLLLAAACCVVLLTCANVAGLSIAKIVGRTPEFAIRSALGAGFARLMQVIWIENLVLIGVSGVAGMLFSQWVVGALWALRPTTGLWADSLTSVGTPAIDPRAVAFAIALTVVTIILASVPAMFAIRRMLLEQALLLRVGRSAGNRGGGRKGDVRKGLVVVQIALAFVLAVDAAAILGNLRAIGKSDFGTASMDVLSVRVELPPARYDAARAAAFYDAVFTRLAAMPGIDAAALDNVTPLHGSSIETAATINIALPQGAGGPGTGVRYHAVDQSYFRLLGIQLRAGTSLNNAGGQTVAVPVVVNETAARRWWPGKNPIGQTVESILLVGSRSDWEPAVVVGVVGDVQYGLPGEPMEPDIYVHYRQDPPLRAYLFVSGVNHRTPSAALVQSIVNELDPALVLSEARTVGERISDASAATRFGAFVLALYATVAIGIALIGVYAIIAFDVVERIREFGIRMALGESKNRILSRVVRDGLVVIITGLICGLLASAAVHRIASSRLIGVEYAGLESYVVVVVLFCVAGVIASLVPASVATRVDPAVVMRSE